MRPLLPAVALIAVAAAVAACGAATEPGWTYAPATPSPSASAAPSDGASAEPSASPSEAASGAPSGGPSGDAVTITAANIAFGESEVEVPADTEFTIRFENNDAGVPHNVEIKDAGNQSVFMGDIFNGVETRDYAVPALAAGEYTFVCTVHPNMTGTLTAG
ncbi:MAG TPA: cupredoxin domain-containing protein [Candidatus Limnocylindrales bacterium]|nr:cupredoxin domain-containing protein [Candidatus Limnocylindrales bacterium]